MLPAELQKLIDDVDTIEREAEALVTPLDAKRANWAPDGGRGWSVLQCVDHLARVNTFYAGAVLPVVRAAAQGGRSGSFTTLTPGWPGRKFVASLEPPVKSRFKTFKQVTPAAALDPGQTLAQFRASHVPYREMVTLAASFDPNRVRVRNPFFNFVPMRLATVLKVIPAHDRRHLWQARNVVAKLPASTI